MLKRIGYGLIFIVLLWLFIWTNNKMTLFVLIAYGVSMIFVVLLNQLIKRNIEIYYEVLPGQNEDIGVLKLEIRNKGFLPANHIATVIKCENAVFTGAEYKKINLSVPGHRNETINIPLKSKYVGRIDFQMQACRVYDWYDITYRTLKNNKIVSCYSYPQEKGAFIENITYSSSEGEEETYKHVIGNDVSEILQLREYKHGDSIRNIYWKLTAKNPGGKPIVKELDSPNDNSVMVLFDYDEATDKKVNNDIICKVCNISNTLMNSQVGHTLFRMDTSKEVVSERSVYEPEEFTAIQTELLETEAKKTRKTTAEYIMNNGIYKKYAKIIYVKSNKFKDESGIENLDQLILETI